VPKGQLLKYTEHCLFVGMSRYFCVGVFIFRFHVDQIKISAALKIRATRQR
jgi:hypothetical protein